MAEEYNGDDKFRDFMDREYNKTDPIVVIIEAIRCKIKAVAEIYSKTLDTYISLDSTDPLKEILKKEIIKLIEHIEQTMDQFNYALISDDGVDDDEEGPPGDPK